MLNFHYLPQGQINKKKRNTIFNAHREKDTANLLLNAHREKDTESKWI